MYIYICIHVHICISLSLLAPSTDAHVYEIAPKKQSQGVSPDLFSYNTLMNVCAKSAKTCARVPGRSQKVRALHKVRFLFN